MSARVEPAILFQRYLDDYTHVFHQSLYTSLQQLDTPFASLSQEHQQELIQGILASIQQTLRQLPAQEMQAEENDDQQDDTPQTLPATSLASISNDSEDIKPLQEKLHQSETRLRTIIEHNADPIVVCSDGIVRFVNPAAEELFGRSCNELIGSELGIPFVAGSEAEVDIVVDKLGTRRVAEMRVVEIAWENAPAYLASFRDITTRKQLEEEMEHKIQERTLMLRQTTERLLVELTEREKAEQVVQGRDAIFEAIEFAAQYFLTSTSLQQGIQGILERLGRATGVSQVTLFKLQSLSEQGIHLTPHALWKPSFQPQKTATEGDEHIQPPPQSEQAMAGETASIDPKTRNFPRWIERLRKGLSIYGDVRVLPPTERKVLEKQHIRSIAVIPIFVQQNWWGFLEFDECVEERAWLLSEAEALKAVANMVGVAIQRERVQKALQQSEERFRMIADFSYDWVYWVGPQGDLLYTSPSCERITGYPPAEFHRSPERIVSLVSPEDRIYLQNVFQKEVSDHHEALSCDFRITTRHGEERWINWVAQPVYDEDGSWHGWRVSNRDITERVYEEQRLRKREATYRAMFEKSPAIKILIDQESGTIVDANPAACHFYGYSLEVLRTKQRKDINLLLAQQGDEEKQRITDDPHSFLTTRHQLASADIRDVEEYIVPIEVHNRTLLYSIVHDITDRLQARQTIQDNEERFREFIEETDNLVSKVDAAGRFLYVNNASEKLFGYPPDACLERLVFDFIHAEDRKRSQVAFEMWLQRRATHATFENRVVHRNGAIFYLRWTINLHYDEAGHATSVNSIAHDITELKRVEQALRESEARYRAISDLISDFAYSLRIETDEAIFLEWATDALSRTTGFSLETLQSRGGWDSLIHPEDVRMVKQHRGWLMAGQASDVFEFRIITRNGETRWLRNHSRPVWDSVQRRVARIYGACQDITERVRTEKALRESELRYRQLVELSPDIILVQCEDTLVFINEEGARRLGAETSQQIVGNSLLDYIAPDSRKVVQEQLLLFLEGKKTRTPFIEEQFLRFDGTVIDVEMAASPFNHQGQPAVLIIARDITERKQVAEALRESEQKFRGFFEQSRDGLVLTDDQGAIIEWSSGAEHIWGFKREEAVHQPIWDVLFQATPADAQNTLSYEQIKANTLELLQTGHMPSLLNRWVWREVQRPDGMRRYVHSLMFSIKMEKGILLGNITRDITEQKHVEEELQRAWQAAEAASQTKSEFLANMSHEIRTPLNAIIGMSTLLFNTPLTTEQQDFVETIRASSDALLTQINDILDFSKIEAGRLTLEHQLFNVCACIEESFDLVAERAAEKHIELAYRIDEQIPCVFLGDLTRVRQIIVNLLSNGVKFTEQGEVVISVSEDKEETSQPQTSEPSSTITLHFEVQDTGIGISHDSLNSLFKSFSQIDTSSTRKYGGSGLGLVMSQRLTELMGGTMWIESAVGVGTIFHVTLTFENVVDKRKETWPDQWTLLASMRKHPGKELAGKNALLVQQDTISNRFFEHWLNLWGIETVRTGTGQEGVDIFQTPSSFDIIFVDETLPDMAGIEVVQSLRSSAQSNLPPLALLAFPDTLLRYSSAEDLDITAVLLKPIKPSYLYTILPDILTRKSLAEESKPPVEVTIDAHMGLEHPLHILLAEDNTLNQKIALHLLQRMGYRADIAANGIEVLNALRRQTYDVVLMDVQMPEMDGIKATQRIRTYGSVERQPWIIAMTAYAMEGDRERCLAAGMNDYVSKPVRVKELIAALLRASDTRKQFVAADEHASDNVQTSEELPAHPMQETDAPEPTSTPEAGEAILFSAPDASAPPLDREAYQQFCHLLGENESAIIQEMIALFLEETPHKIAELQQAVEQHDAQRLAYTAHALKSSCAQIGAIPLSELCQQMESAGQTNHLADSELLLVHIKAEYERVQAVLPAESEQDPVSSPDDQADGGDPRL